MSTNISDEEIVRVWDTETKYNNINEYADYLLRLNKDLQEVVDLLNNRS